MSDTSPKSKIELAIELIKILIWPFVVLAIMIVFCKPLYNTVNEIPSLIQKSESITVGSLSLKIYKNAKLKPSDTVKTLLANISPQMVDVLVSSSGRTEYFTKHEVLYGKERFNDLITGGLYSELDSIHLGQDPTGNKYYYGVMPTQNGIEARKFLMSVLTGLINEI